MSEKKVAARQQEEKRKTVIYLGPAIPGVTAYATVYNNGLPQQLESAVKEEPALSVLLVPVEKAARAKERLKDKTSPISVCYKKAEEYAAQKGKRK